MSELVHEMRNQLAIAVANLEAFVDGKLEPSKPRLEAVLQALAELDALIGSVALGGGGTGAHSASCFDVCSIIKNEAIAVEPLAARKQLTLSTLYCAGKHPDCEQFVGDPERVGRMVKNILINAIRYTPEGGAIAVECRHSPDELSFSVSDSGPGVEPGEAERIFSPGVRGSAGAKAPGDGLGLSVVKRVAEEHGGRVTVAGNSQSGATFTVALPGGAAPSTPSP